MYYFTDPETGTVNLIIFTKVEVLEKIIEIGIGLGHLFWVYHYIKEKGVSGRVN